MAQSYRYPITRVCLRTGTLTLPINLLGVFPAHGDITVRDSEGAEFVWRVDGRRVYGIDAFFNKHALTPNDELTISADDAGFFRVEPLRRPKSEAPKATDWERVVNHVVEEGLALSEAEIRARHPGIPTGPELRKALAAEPKLEYRAGRWHRRTLAATPLASEPSTVTARETAPAPTPAPATPEREAVNAEAHQAREEEQAKRREAARRAAQEAEEQRAAAARRREVEATLEAQEERERHVKMMVEADEYAEQFGRFDSVADLSDLPDVQRASRARLHANAEADAMAEARRQRDARADADRSAGSVGEGNELEMFAWDQPLVRRLRFPWLKRRDADAKSESPRVLDDPLKLDRLGEPRPVRREIETATRVQPLPRPNLFGAPGVGPQTLTDGDPALTRRAREAFTALGFRVEGLVNGQLMLHVDYGRRKERILVHVMAGGDGLPWGPLLDRRRVATASHLAVLGEQRDLHREVAPAELAKATLWSWTGLDRVLEIAKTLPLGPIDLVEHFERDGMAEFGLERFERNIHRRTQERAALSSVLESLARMRVPSMFMVEDVVTGLDLPRDHAVRALEHLCEAPWHLVTRVDSGEFCLRYRVADALTNVGAYVGTLAGRLPTRDRETLQALPSDVEPIDGMDVQSAPVERVRRKAKTMTVAHTEEDKVLVAQEPLIKL